MSLISTLGFGMAIQFKPDGHGGWLYRKDQIGAPLPASQAEYDGYVRWYGWIVASSLLIMFGLVIGPSVVIARYIPDPDNATGVLIAIPMVVVAFGGTYLYLKFFSHAPARAFAGRTPVGPAQTLAQVHGKRMRRMTGRRLFFAIAAMTGMLALGAFNPEISDADRPLALALAIGLPLVIGLGFWLWKRRVMASEHG